MNYSPIFKGEREGSEVIFGCCNNDMGALSLCYMQDLVAVSKENIGS